MRPWNLLLRFFLEVGALIGLGVAAWSRFDGATRWAAVVALPSAAAGAWGTFNVRDDPSRSGEAPVQVRGPVRLAIELTVLAAGWVGFAVAGNPVLGAGFALLTAVHYSAGRARIEWLIRK